MSKDIPFDELEIGMTFGPVPFNADEKAIKRYCDEMKDYNPIYLKDSPFGGPVVPPLLSATLQGLSLIGTKYDAHATVPAKLIQKNIKPAKVGSRLTLSGTLVDKYIKKGLEYAVIESAIKDENGSEIRRVTDHFLLSLERKADAQRQPEGSDTSNLLREETGKVVANTKIKVGREVPSLTKIAYQRALDEVSFRENSSHKADYAKSKGYANALLSGYILCGYISEFIVNFFGPDWLKGGEISLSFVRATYQNDQVTIKGAVTNKVKEKDGTSVTIDFWMEKTDGTKVVVGNASGTIKK